LVEKTIEETTETKDNNPETIEVCVIFKRANEIRGYEVVRVI